MSWEVVERMTIYHDEGMYALAPNVVRTPSGDLMVFFQRAPHLGYPTTTIRCPISRPAAPRTRGRPGADHH